MRAWFKKNIIKPINLFCISLFMTHIGNATSITVESNRSTISFIMVHENSLTTTGLHIDEDICILITIFIHQVQSHTHMIMCVCITTKNTPLVHSLLSFDPPHYLHMASLRPGQLWLHVDLSVYQICSILPHINIIQFYHIYT